MKPKSHRASRTGRRIDAPRSGRPRRRLRRAIPYVLVALVAAALVWGALPAAGIPSQAKRYIAYYRNYSRLITPAQLAIRNEALGSIPAPCCDEYSIATCCCPCNLAKTVWGLASHLIVERGAGVATVKREVERWLTTINPEGAAGDACKRGRCEHPFHEDGCGGMNERRIS